MCLCVIGIIVCIGFSAWNYTIKKDQQEILEDLRDHLKEQAMETVTHSVTEEPPMTEETESAPVQTEALTTEVIPPETEAVTTAVQTTAAVTEPPKQKPDKKEDALLDFSYMYMTNPDIYAWIEIEGTKVNYPILQNRGNDDKYLNTAIDGSYYIGGSLFTQASYNKRDFNDPVTIIYGHTMRSGTLFGQLQSTYSAKDSFAAHSRIKLYLPGELRYYTVFAAVPYSSMHILDAYDFKNPYWYNQFFRGVSKIRDFGAQFNRDIVPKPGDRVIILSTCLNEDSTKRFLVLAVLQDDIP